MARSSLSLTHSNLDGARGLPEGVMKMLTSTRVQSFVSHTEVQEQRVRTDGFGVSRRPCYLLLISLKVQSQAEGHSSPLARRLPKWGASSPISMPHGRFWTTNGSHATVLEWGRWTKRREARSENAISRLE